MDVSALLERVKRLPVIRSVIAVQQRYGEEGAGLFASAMAYHAFFSLFPLLLVVVAVLGFVLDDEQTRRDVLGRIAQSVPGLRNLVSESLDAIIDARTATGIVGLAGLIWTGTAVVRAAGAAMTHVFELELEGDNIIKQNLWALGALGVLGTLAAVSTGLGVGVTMLPGWTETLMLIPAAAVDVGLFLIAYRVLVRGRGPAWRALVPGALLGGIAWGALKVLGSWFAQRTVSGASAVYGTFAGAIAILAVLSLGARIFLYGAVLIDWRIDARDAERRSASRARGAA